VIEHRLPISYGKLKFFLVGTLHKKGKQLRGALGSSFIYGHPMAHIILSNNAR
jgi:hypothetical protein